MVIQWDTIGFGAVVILPTLDGKENPPKKLQKPPLIEAHKSSIQDFDLSPFDKQLLVSSDSSSIKLWKIPEGGLKDTMRLCELEISGEVSKRLTSLQFHPTSKNLLVTTGKDFKIKIFDIENTKLMISHNKGHNDLIQNISFNWTGSLLSTSCKDKILRILDPRLNEVAYSTEAHPGVKGFNCTWLGKRDEIMTCGFNKSGERIVSLWDLRTFKDPIHSNTIDNSPGMIKPFYDESTKMVFLLGRGDSAIRYYEIIDQIPFVQYLDQFKGNDSQSDICAFPKRMVDVASCEIVRFAKVTKDKVENIMFQVPRRDGKNVSDLYTFIPSNNPSTTAEEWLKGIEKAPILINPSDFMPAGYITVDTIEQEKNDIPSKNLSRNSSQKTTSNEKSIFFTILKEKELVQVEKNIIYDGPFKNGKKNGYGNLTAIKENIKFEGDWIDDIRYGNGIISCLTEDGKVTMTAKWDGFFFEPSSFEFADGLKIESPILNENKNLLFAKLTLKNGDVYHGQFSNGMKNGKGIYIYQDGSKYEGDFKNDLRDGKGLFNYLDGSIYDGFWKEDQPFGKGQYIDLSNRKFNGNWPL